MKEIDFVELLFMHNDNLFQVDSTVLLRTGTGAREQRDTKYAESEPQKFFLYLKGVCHEIFDPHFFICQCHLDPDKQVKIFSKLVSISPRYSKF